MENKHLKNFKKNFYLEKDMVKISFIIFSHLALLFVSFQNFRTSIVRWSKPALYMARKFLAYTEIISINLILWYIFLKI